MSTTPSDNDELNDADIAALFDAETNSSQFPKPPAELDALILQHAQDAHLDSANTVPTETFAQKYRPVIASAAVLLIGIGITPMGIQTPQTESDDVAAYRDTESSQILSKSQSHSAPKVNSNESEFTQAQAVPNGIVSSASESDLRSQTSPENYRSSPLLWVVEIKRLHHEKNTDKAREELIAFRKAYPNNSNERLLPEELKKIRLD